MCMQNSHLSKTGLSSHGPPGPQGPKPSWPVSWQYQRWGTYMGKMYSNEANDGHHVLYVIVVLGNIQMQTLTLRPNFEYVD